MDSASRLYATVLIVPIYVAVFLAVRWLHRYLTHRWQKSMSSGTTQIGRTRASPAVVLLLGGYLMLVAFFVFAAIARWTTINVGFYGLIFTFLVIAAYLVLCVADKWEWDGQGLTWKRLTGARTLSWIDLTAFGYSIMQQHFFVTDFRGARIVWSDLRTLDADLIAKAVALRRPDLAEKRTRVFW